MQALIDPLASEPFSSRLDALQAVLGDCGDAVIAVSGGVDSTSLAAFAHRLGRGRPPRMAHAVSPAVPTAASERVRRLAESEGWQISILDAGEFADERYRLNPLDRCYFCKTNLYRTLSRFVGSTILSGANLDDLGDYRPGLVAAAEHGVRHPYIEAGFTKADVRALARHLGLVDLAELPASPCLSSRVETGLRIEARDLGLIEAVETWVRARLDASAVRLRVMAKGFVVQLDGSVIRRLEAEGALSGLRTDLVAAFPELARRPLTLAPYERGSAFVGDKNAVMSQEHREREEALP